MQIEQDFYGSMRQTAQERYRLKYPPSNRPRFDPHNPRVQEPKRLRSLDQHCIRPDLSKRLSSDFQSLFQPRSPGEERTPMPNLMKLQLSKYGRHCFDQVDFKELNQKDRANIRLYNQYMENMYYLEAEHSKINPRRRQLKQYTSFGFSAAGRGGDGLSSNIGQSIQRAQSPQSTTHIVTESQENPLTIPSSNQYGVGTTRPPYFAQEMLMLFDNNIIKNKKKSLDRMIGPRDHPTIEINSPHVTQIDVSMMNSPLHSQIAEQDTYPEPIETKLYNYDQKVRENPFGQFPRTFQATEVPAVTQRQLNVDMKTSIGGQKQIYGGVITTREDPTYYRAGSPSAVIVKRGSVPERQAILTRQPDVQEGTETDQATAIGYRMTVEENEIQTGSKELLQVNLQDIVDPLFQSKQQTQTSQGHGSANVAQRETTNQSGYLQVQRDIHAIEVAENPKPLDNDSQQQSGTGNLYQQRGRNPKLNQEQPSENMLQTLPVDKAYPQIIVKQEEKGFTQTQDRISIINNSNQMMQDGQNQTSKEKSLTSYEASFAPLAPSDMRENQKIKVAGESPIAFNGAVGLFNTVKIHHSHNQTHKIQHKQKRMESNKGKFDLEIHYLKDQKVQQKEDGKREGTPAGSIDEEKMLQEVKLITSGDILNQRKDKEPRGTLKLNPEQLRQNSSDQQYVQLPAPTPSPKKIYKFGVLGGKDDIDNSCYMSQIQRSGQSLHERKSTIHPTGAITTAFKFVDRDDKQSDEQQPLVQTILPCMQIKLKQTKDRDDLSHQSLSRHENTLSAKSKPVKSALQSLTQTPSKPKRENIAISQGHHEVKSSQQQNGGPLSVKSQDNNKAKKGRNLKNQKSQGKNFQALPVSQVRIKSKALILNNQDHYDDVFQRVKTRHEMKIRKLPASYMQQNRYKQTQNRILQDHNLTTPNGQYMKEKKQVNKFKQSFDQERLLTDHVSLDPGSDLETQGRSSAAQWEKGQQGGRPSILSADARRRGKPRAQKKYHTLHGSPDLSHGSTKQRISPDVMVSSNGQGPIKQLYVPLNLQTQQLSKKNDSVIRGRNISPDSGGELAKDSRNGSSLIPTERSPNNHRNSPDQGSRYCQEKIVPAGAAITSIRYQTKGGHQQQKKDDSSPRPKIKNQRLCDQIEKPQQEDIKESKKVTPQISSAHFTPFNASGNVSPSHQEEDDHFSIELKEQQELQKQRLLRLSRQYLQRSGGQSFSMSRTGMNKGQGNARRNIMSPKSKPGQGILVAANQRSLNLKSLNLKKKLLEGMLIYQQQQINQGYQEDITNLYQPTQTHSKLGSGDFVGSDQFLRYEEKELLDYAKSQHGGQTIDAANEFKTAPLTILNMRKQVFRGNESGGDLTTEQPPDVPETKRKDTAAKGALHDGSQPELLSIPIREQIVNIQEKSDNLEPENISFDKPDQILDPYNTSLNQTEKFPANTAMQSIGGRNFANAIYDNDNVQTTKRVVEELSEIKSGTISASVLKGPNTATFIENIEKKREKIQIEKNKLVVISKNQA